MLIFICNYSLSTPLLLCLNRICPLITRPHVCCVSSLFDVLKVFKHKKISKCIFQVVSSSLTQYGKSFHTCTSPEVHQFQLPQGCTVSSFTPTLVVQRRNCSSKSSRELRTKLSVLSDSECPLCPLVPPMYAAMCYLLMPPYHSVTAGKGCRTQS